MRTFNVVLITVLLGFGLIGLATGSQLLTAQTEAQPMSAKHASAKGIQDVEALYASLDFDPTNRYHMIRKQRIEHYLSLARKYDNSDWVYNRDEALDRARNILEHHERKTSGIYASL